MAPLALAYAVIAAGGGARALGVVLASNTVPTIVFLLAGGVLADRMSRSRILFFGNLLAAAAQAMVTMLVATGHATTGPIAACGFVSGVATAFSAPATQGIVVQLVAAEHLQQANALVRLPSNTMKVLGPVVAGVVVALAGPAWALGWDAVTFAVAALLLLGLRLTPLAQGPSSAPSSAPAAPPSGVLADLRAGWAGFWSRTWLWTYTASGTVVVAAWLAGYGLLGPIVAAERYDGARAWGLVQGAFALGLLGGTVVSLRWRPYRLLAVALAGSTGIALTPAAMGLGLPLPYVLLGAPLGGAMLDVAVVCWSTALQQHVPQAEIGRMSSFNHVGELLAVPVGYLLTALAAPLWSASATMLTCAITIVVVTVLNLFLPAVYRVNRT